MTTKEIKYDGFTMNGFLMLLVNLLLLVGSIVLLVWGVVCMEDSDAFLGTSLLVIGGVALIASCVIWCGFLLLEPNEARVLTFFGRYRGTFTQTGYYWVNPFMAKKKLSLRARNLDAEPIKVNDKTGNPVMIGMVLVWKLRDTYKAVFEIDSQTMAASSEQVTIGTDVRSMMQAFERFVRVQGDAALRQVASLYAYDSDNDEPTLRSNADEINQQLEQKLGERLAMAGIEIVEARLNYLAYAPEIAAVMLRRQQADAIIQAREKIVEGAVSMVKMALQRLADEDVVELDDDKKAAMVSNLLVVLCGDEAAQPVVNTGTLHH